MKNQGTMLPVYQVMGMDANVIFGDTRSSIVYTSKIYFEVASKYFDFDVEKTFRIDIETISLEGVPEVNLYNHELEVYVSMENGNIVDFQKKIAEVDGLTHFTRLSYLKEGKQWYLRYQAVPMSELMLDDMVHGSFLTLRKEEAARIDPSFTKKWVKIKAGDLTGLSTIWYSVKNMREEMKVILPVLEKGRIKENNQKLIVFFNKILKKLQEGKDLPSCFSIITSQKETGLIPHILYRSDIEFNYWDSHYARIDKCERILEELKKIG